MALTVEDGTGLTNADSYLSSADADSYHTKHSNSSSWSGASTSVKEAALRMATQYINVTYRLRWKGIKIDKDQALDWPRLSVVDRDGYNVAADALPQAIKDACAEMALREVTETNSLIVDEASPGRIKRETDKVGAIESTVEYMGGRSQQKKFTLIDRILSDLIEPIAFVLERA